MLRHTRGFANAVFGKQKFPIQYLGGNFVPLEDSWDMVDYYTQCKRENHQLVKRQERVK